MNNVETKKGMKIENFISHAVNNNFIISVKPKEDKEPLILVDKNDSPDWVLINIEKNIILLVNESEGKLEDVQGVLKVSYDLNNESSVDIEKQLNELSVFEQTTFENGLMNKTIYPSLTNNLNEFIDTINGLSLKNEKLDFDAKTLEVLQGFQNATSMKDYQLQFHVSKVLGEKAVSIFNFQEQNKSKRTLGL